MFDPALLSGIIKLTILLLIQYASGSLVFYKGVKVNYTGKINHFALFFVPMFIMIMKHYFTLAQYFSYFNF